MNLFHQWFCRSSLWSRLLRTRIVVWGLDGVDLGSSVLEIGPGYGSSTVLLQSRCRRLTCVEVDAGRATRLQARMKSPGITVLEGDASHLKLPDAMFDGVTCFMAIHHVEPAEKQDRLFDETFRVLRPGGVFAGVDSPPSMLLQVLHLFDTVAMIDPPLLTSRLYRAGFREIEVDSDKYVFRFRARKPITTTKLGAVPAEECSTSQGLRNCRALGE